MTDWDTIHVVEVTDATKISPPPAMSKLKVLATYFLLQLAPDVAAVVLSFTVGQNALCPGQPFLQAFLVSGWAQIVVHLLLFGCFWKIVIHDHDDYLQHCRFMLTFVLFAILFFWSNVWTIWWLRASFSAVSYQPDVLNTYDTDVLGEVDHDSMSYGQIHAHATLACDDLDVLAKKVKRSRSEGLEDGATDACWYVLKESCDPDLWSVSRSLAWFWLVFEVLTALALCACCGFACTYPKEVGEALHC